jgi:hypothetical protein
LVDKLIALAQNAYDRNKADVVPGSFNPEFTVSVTLFVCDGHKGSAMQPVPQWGTKDLLSKITIKVCLRPARHPPPPRPLRPLVSYTQDRDLCLVHHILPS